MLRLSFCVPLPWRLFKDPPLSAIRILLAHLSSSRVSSVAVALSLAIVSFSIFYQAVDIHVCLLCFKTVATCLAGRVGGILGLDGGLHETRA